MDPLLLKNAKYIFLLINIMHFGVTWKLFVGYLAALNADYPIINALLHNTGDLQKYLELKQMPILV